MVTPEDPKFPDIARAGGEEVLSRHSVDVRAAQMMTILQELHEGHAHEGALPTVGQLGPA